MEALQLDFLSYVHITQMSMAERLEDTGVVSKFAALEPKSIPTSSVERREFGVDEVKTICKHFGVSKGGVEPLFDPEAAQREYSQFKNTVNLSWSKCSYEEAASKFISVFATSHPNITIVLCIGLVLPMTTVPCEQLFSIYNFIRNDYRTMLTSDHATDLMRLHAMYREKEISNVEMKTIAQECARQLDLDRPHKFHSAHNLPRDVFSWNMPDVPDGIPEEEEAAAPADEDIEE
jgi:hypothetical protein